MTLFVLRLLRNFRTGIALLSFCQTWFHVLVGKKNNSTRMAGGTNDDVDLDADLWGWLAAHAIATIKKPFMFFYILF